MSPPLLLCKSPALATPVRHFPSAGYDNIQMHRVAELEQAQAPSVPNVPRLSTWEWLSFNAAHGGAAFLLKLLGIRGLYRFARIFGTLEWLINHRRRRRFAKALARVIREPLSPPRRRAITRENFCQTRCDKIFYLIFDAIPRERARTLLAIGNRQLLEEAIARTAGRGVYVPMSHHGSIHIAGLLMALSGYKVAGVRERSESGLRRYVQDRLDRRHPDFQRARIIYADAFPREIFRCLQEGYLLASLMDVARKYHANQRTETVEVFGEQREFLSGPLRVAYRSRVPVIQAFVIPERDFRYRLEFVADLFGHDPGQDEDAAVSGAMLAYAANVERVVRETPSLLSRL